MSRPPEHPGGPSDPWSGNPNPSDYPPPPGYGPPPGPPPGYGPPPGPPPGYGPPPGPPPGYGPPPPGYGGPPPPGYGPPQPGYGAPQPGYPPPGYPPPAGHQFNISDAFSWAWNKFGKNAVPLIVAILVYAVIGVVLHVLVYSLLGGPTNQINAADSSGTSSLGGLDTVGLLVLEILSFVFGVFVQAGFLSGTLDIADGRPVSIGSFFKPRNFGNVVLAGALLAVIGALLDSLSLIPSFIGPLLAFVALAVFTFFALFTIAFATDRGLSPIDALKASFATVRSDIGSTLLSFVVQALLVLLGALACGVGVLVGVPLALLIQVYTYRRLSGGTIAPLTP